MRGQAGFWDIDERYVRLSEAGDPLEKLKALVPWEVFRKPLAKALKCSDGAKGGRPPSDPVMMFKIIVLQALYGLSDDQAEFQIQDRLSLMRLHRSSKSSQAQAIGKLLANRFRHRSRVPPALHLLSVFRAATGRQSRRAPMAGSSSNHP